MEEDFQIMASEISLFLLTNSDFTFFLYLLILKVSCV